DRAVAEETNCDAIFLAIFRGKRHSRGKRNVRANNRVPAVHVIFLVEKMHRAAEPLATAGCFAKKFGHARIWARAAGKRVAVIAISSDDVVVIANGGDSANDHSLLPNVKMTEAADLARLIMLARALHEPTNEPKSHVMRDDEWAPQRRVIMKDVQSHIRQEQ